MFSRPIQVFHYNQVFRVLFHFSLYWAITSLTLFVLNNSSIVFFQVIHSLNLLRLPIGIHSTRILGRHSSFILRNFSYYLSLLCSIVCKTSCLTSLISRIPEFVNLFSLHVLAELRQKYISVERGFFYRERFKVYVSEPYSKMLTTTAL